MQVLIIPDVSTYDSPARWQTVIDKLSAANLYAEAFEYDDPKSDDLSLIIEDVQSRLVDATYIVGIGIGGRVAIQLAAQNPHHITGFLLLRTPAVPAPGFSSFIKKVLHFIFTPIRIIIPYYLRKKFMEEWTKRLPGDPAKNQYAAISKPSLESFMPKISDPLLMLWGDKDKMVPPAVADTMSELLTKADVPHDLIFVSGGADALHISHPDVVAQTILTTISKL